MVVTGCPFHSQHGDEDTNPTEPHEQSPLHSKTLGFPNPSETPINDQIVQTSQQSDDHEDSLTILDGYDQQSSKTHTTLPEPIAHANDTKNPLRSPKNYWRRSNKRKKGGRNKWVMNKIENLKDALNFIAFKPKALYLDKHEDVLKRLGLYEFSTIEFDHRIRTDLLVQLIVNYDSKKHCSYVNEKRILVSRAALAKALKLPAMKQDKGSRPVVEVDLDSDVYSDEVIGFIEDFVFNWMLLHEESWIMPVEIVNWTRCIRDGHPEKLDSSSLIWYKVEKELSQGDKLSDCYYASHLQHLIRSQKDQLLKDEDDDCAIDDGEEIVKADEQPKEKVSVVQKDDVELNLGSDVEKTVHQEVRKANETMVDTEECEVRQDNETMVNAEECAVRKDDETMVDAEECVVIKDDETMVDVEECTEKEVAEEMEEQLNWKNGLNESILQRCQSSDLNDYEEIKVQEVNDQEIEQVKDKSEEEGADGRFVENFGMKLKDDLMDDGLTGNFHQSVEISNIPYGSHGVSSMDIFRSRDDSFMSHGGLSFFDNCGKRVMELEEDMHHLDGNSKKLKTNEMWDYNQNDFGFYMMQMQHWMEKAKMIHELKEESFANSHCHQNLAMSQMQEHNQMMEMVIKSREEELEKKNAEVSRLERELYLMEQLLAGYRKALNDMRFKFSEYRRHVVALQEEPLYKDAGPGGLVLSTQELEKQRLKQENMMNFQALAKSFEEDWVCQMKIQYERASKMAEKLVFVGNELKKVKELAAHRKGTQKPWNELQSSPKPEENSKSHDEVSENDANKEAVPLTSS
ncbi:hypothetical protein R6Q57_014499 [Mikania cordata]